MHLTLYGFTRAEKKLLKHAVNHFIGNLVHRNLAANLKLRVYKQKKSADALGSCYPYDDYRQFDILVHGRFAREDLLRIVAHECVHIKQWATRERVDYKRYANKVKFQGKTYDTDTLKYPTEPWELDAYYNEEGLVVRFLADYPEHRKTT